MEQSSKILIGAVDQGTSSTRFLIFAAETAELITYHQVELKNLYPKDGWVEQDPMEILESAVTCINKAVENLEQLGYNVDDVKGIGITNQRETTIVWDPNTGVPLHNAIVWLDTRTADTVQALINTCPNKSKSYLQSRCGLPITTYFSAVKVRWMLDNVVKVRDAVDSGNCLFGNVDSWLLWNFTGGALGGGIHVTDVTNASRTMLMNLKTLDWDVSLCNFFGVPRNILPEIKSSSEVYGNMTTSSLYGKPIAGILGDQQAALVGQRCFKKGQAKNTYGTGCFMLYHTGPEIVQSTSGLLTTVAYKFGSQPAQYALEGSVAIAGACVQWLRDSLDIIKESSEVETLASRVKDTGDCYFVPAFAGLFCPYWMPDARGVLCGLTQYTSKEHIARATLEAVCFQSVELLDAMNSDSGIPLRSLQVDGGMTKNSLLMQLQADLCGIPVVRPLMPETTALGAAMAAGVALKLWIVGEDVTQASGDSNQTFIPSVTAEERSTRMLRWKQAVKRSMHWVSPDQKTGEGYSSSARLFDRVVVQTGGVFLFGSFLLLALSNVWKS